MLCASVPKAPINEHSHPCPRKNDVRADCEVASVNAVILAKSVSTSVEKAANRTFWRGVHSAIAQHGFANGRARCGWWRGDVREVGHSGARNRVELSRRIVIVEWRSMSTSTQVQLIDLFAGAGGLSLGGKAAGATPLLAVEMDPTCCATLRANGGHHGHVAETSVTELTGENLRELGGVTDSAPLLIVGGPPCQPFSKAAYWTDDGAEARYRRAREAGKDVQRPDPPRHAKRDARRSLVAEFWRLVVEADADAFVFENVRSITHPRHRPVLNRFIADATSAGFSTITLSVNAAEYGVPQLRHRVFVIGSKHAEPVPPEPTHAKPAVARERGLCPFETVGECLKPYSSRDWSEPEEVVRGKWADHLRQVPPGQNYKFHTAWAGHQNPSFVTETRFWNFLLKLSPRLPSWTINASPGPWTGPFHWRSRRLRTPEIGAIQTFPHGYRFEGSHRDRVRQIGNAAPPMLSQVMIAAALETIGLTREKILAEAA